MNINCPSKKSTELIIQREGEGVYRTLLFVNIREAITENKEWVWGEEKESGVENGMQR